MRRKFILLVTMLCMAFVGVNAQNGGNGNGNGQPPHNPIEITIKGKDNGTNGQGGTINLPVSASYTSDTLFIDVTDYSGDIEVEVVNTLTNQTVLQTFDLITGGSGTVEVDISALTHGIYRVDIYLPSSSGSYEGFFEIE